MGAARPGPGRRRTRPPSGLRATTASGREIWKGRKSAFSAVGRLSPDFIVNDGVVPAGRSCRTRSRRSRRSRRRYGLRSPTCSTPATATSTRSSCTTDGRQGSWSGPRRSPARSWTCASASAARSRASTAWGWRSGRTWSACTRTADVAAMRRIRLAVDPQELANRGKVLPTGPIVETVRPDRGGGPAEPAAAACAASHSLRRPPSMACARRSASRARCCRAAAGPRPALSTPVRPDVAILDLSGLTGIVDYEPSRVRRHGPGRHAHRGHRAACSRSTASACRSTRCSWTAGATLGGYGCGGHQRPRSVPSRRRPRLRARARASSTGRRTWCPDRGRVVKNVAGFDLPRLLAGSIGRSAVARRGERQGLPAPGGARHAGAARAGLEDALARVAALTLSRFDIDALDLVARTGMRRWCSSAWRDRRAVAAGSRLERLRGHLGAGDLAPRRGGDAGASARELSWVPPGWSLAMVPVTLPQVARLEALLRGTGALRRYGAGGQVAWVASAERPEELGRSWMQRASRACGCSDPWPGSGLGARGGAIIGRGVANELGRRVEAGARSGRPVRGGLRCATR